MMIGQTVSGDGESRSGPFQRIAAKESTARVQAALDALPEQERVVIFYRVFEDETLEQVADRLDLSRAQVRKIQESGFERLRASWR